MNGQENKYKNWFYKLQPMIKSDIYSYPTHVFSEYEEHTKGFLVVLNSEVYTYEQAIEHMDKYYN